MDDPLNVPASNLMQEPTSKSPEHLMRSYKVQFSFDIITGIGHQRSPMNLVLGLGKI